MSEFDGKTVVVTGAAGVLGRAVANAFHGAGANVIGLDIVEADSIKDEWAALHRFRLKLASFQDVCP